MEGERGTAQSGRRAAVEGGRITAKGLREHRERERERESVPCMTRH